MAVAQETNECQVDQAVQQGFLFGDRVSLTSLVSSLNEFRLTDGQKMSVSNSGVWSFYRLGSQIVPSDTTIGQNGIVAKEINAF